MRPLRKAAGIPREAASGRAVLARWASRPSSMSTAVSVSPGTLDVTARMTCMNPIGPAAPITATRSPARSSPSAGAIA